VFCRHHDGRRTQSAALAYGIMLSDNTTYQADLLAVIPKHDLALLKIEPKQPLTAVRFSRDSLIIGEPVIVIGNPMGMLSAMLDVERRQGIATGLEFLPDKTCLVGKVAADSPAAKAGIQRRGNFEDAIRPGQKAAMVFVRRNGKTTTHIDLMVETAK
jgi:S1-C subfamily serine protease